MPLCLQGCVFNCLCNPYPQTLGLILGPVSLAAVRENNLTAIDFPLIYLGIHSFQFVLCFFAHSQRQLEAAPAQVTVFEISTGLPSSSLPTSCIPSCDTMGGNLSDHDITVQMISFLSPPSAGRWSGDSSNMHPIFEGLFLGVILGPNYCISHMTHLNWRDSNKGTVY